MSTLDDKINNNQPPNFKISMEEMMNDDIEDAYESDSSTDMNLAPDDTYDLDQSHESVNSANDEWMDDDDEGVCVLEIDVSKLSSIHEDPAFYALSRRCVDDSDTEEDDDEDDSEEEEEDGIDEIEFINISKTNNKNNENEIKKEDNDDDDEDEDDEDFDSQLDADVELVRKSLELAAVMERDGKHGEVEAVLSQALNELYCGHNQDKHTDINQNQDKSKEKGQINDVYEKKNNEEEDEIKEVCVSVSSATTVNVQLNTSMTSVDSSVNNSNISINTNNTNASQDDDDEAEVITSSGLDEIENETQTDNSNGTTSSANNSNDNSSNNHKNHLDIHQETNQNNSHVIDTDIDLKLQLQLQHRERTSTEYTDVSAVTCVSGNDGHGSLNPSNGDEERVEENEYINHHSYSKGKVMISKSNTDHKNNNRVNRHTSKINSSSSSSKSSSSNSKSRVFSKSAFATHAFIDHNNNDNNNNTSSSSDPYDVYDPFQEVQCFHLPIIFEPGRTGFEASKDLCTSPGTIIAGRFKVTDYCSSKDQAAFSKTIQCIDLKVATHKARLNEAGKTEEAETLDQWVCLKVIKNNKDYMDQSLDEIKLLHYINTNCDPCKKHILELRDFFYYKEHLIIATELLCDNLYAFSRYIDESDGQIEPFFTLPRLKRITYQIIDALGYIHSLGLIHCDVKPENIVIKSYTRCEVKLIDFGATCFITDRLSTYIQSRSYRAPEVILGALYDQRIYVWSYGAVLAELFTGYVLFQSRSVPRMLARITGVLGPFHPSFLNVCKNVEPYLLNGYTFFYEKQSLSSSSTTDHESHGHDDISKPNSMKIILPKITSLSQRLHLSLPQHLENTLLTEEDVVAGLCTAQEQEESQFLDFVRSALTVDWRQRPSCLELLEHEWLGNTYSDDIQELVHYTDTAGDVCDEIAETESDNTYDNNHNDDTDNNRRESQGCNRNRDKKNTSNNNPNPNTYTDVDVNWEDDDSAEFENILTQR